jgi:UDP-sulfoquinovose synthase
VTVVVLGADGYLGWALTCQFAATLREPIVAVDDLSKRRRVAEIGSASAIPILPFAERVERLRAATGRRDIVGETADVADCAAALAREHRPRAMVHLAQIPSAPYSMQSFAAARETLVNNEVGNLAVLFALREHSPQTHLVKMGSMGEYARVGVPLGEGYVEAVLDGEPASRPIPFPREADDVYHVSKINDTNYLSMACRVWGLAATDVMQSIVYGVRSPLSAEHPELATRLDCDPMFGSVVNRFCAQAVCGVPLTVHAGGTGTTGLIALPDVMAALAHWVAVPAAPGEHRVINQATEARISILDLARLVQRVAGERGLRVELDLAPDPRHELERPGSGGPARTERLRQAPLPGVALEEEVRWILEVLARNGTVCTAARQPSVDWKTGATERGRRRAPRDAPTLSPVP